MSVKRVVLNEDGTVPASWYDEEYWENGAASGKMSYNGNDYKDNLGACKYWAQDTYNRWGPFKTYLELGCGRGWAIWGFNNLPELGVTARGIDLSPYAASTSVVKDQISVGSIADMLVVVSAINSMNSAGVDDIAPVDLIFSNDVFEHLTERQLDNCLTVCRSFSNRAVHLISVGDNIDVRGSVPVDQDQSHITLRSKKWWVDLFDKKFMHEAKTVAYPSSWEILFVDHGRTIELDCVRTK